MFLKIIWICFSISCTCTVGDEDFGIAVQNNTTKLSHLFKNVVSTLWLKELLQSYELAFPRQIIEFQKYKNVLTIPNQNKWRDRAGHCENVSSLSVEQNKRLENKYGEDFVLKATIQKMIENPRARLYRYKNYQGDFEDYNFSKSKRNGICTAIKKLAGSVKSAFLFGKCIRLFKSDDCRGWSMAVYAGSSNSNRISNKLKVEFRSIGPCLKNEFSVASIDKTRPSFLLKNPHLRGFNPDLAFMTSDGHRPKGPKLLGTIAYEFTLGLKNRTDVIFAVFSNGILDNVDPKEKPRKNQRDFHESADQEKADIVGYAIPPNFGGPTTERLNSFPGTQSSVEEWNDVLLSLRGDVAAVLLLNFEYENENKTRPLFFYYTFMMRKEPDSVLFDQIFYGRIMTGGRVKAKREHKYLHVIPAFKGATTNIQRIYGNYKIISGRNPELTNNFVMNLNTRNKTRLAVCQHILSTNQSRMTNSKNIDDQSSTVSTIQGIVKNPMVVLFSEQKCTGYSEEYHSGKRLSRYEGCHDLNHLYSVKSAVTFGKCIRLFEGRMCTGWSKAIYGSNCHSGNLLDRRLKLVLSVGPCLDDEFVNATFQDKKKQRLVKHPGSDVYFDDLVQFTSEADLLGRLEEDSKMEFKTGHNNRIEHIEAIVNTHGCGKISDFSNLKDSDIFKSLDKREGDVPCFAIPLEVEGPANASNVFPASQASVGRWSRIFPTHIYEKDKVIILSMSFVFVYENDWDTRPTFVFYHFHNGISKTIYYGRFINY